MSNTPSRPGGRRSPGAEASDARANRRADLERAAATRRMERPIRGDGDTGRDAGRFDMIPAPIRRWSLRLGAALVAMIVAIGVLDVIGVTDEIAQFVGHNIIRVPGVPDIDNPAQGSILTDANGVEFTRLSGAENRTAVTLDDVPQVLVDAVLSTEDADFYAHEGVDVTAIGRAAIKNIIAGGVSQGGSTITQQYVKNALLTNERSFDRKIKEAIWALDVEDTLGKDEILTRYLNIVYLGGGNYGVEAASQYYFGIPASDLDLNRASLLAGIIASPEGANPVSDPEAAKARQLGALDRMVATEMITAEEARAAAEVPIAALLDVTPQPAIEQAFFVEYVKQQLLQRPELGGDRDARARMLFEGGLTITTTIDMDLQDAADAAVRAVVTDPEADPLAGLVSVDSTSGAVKAMAFGPKAFGPCPEEPCSTTTVNPLVPGLGGSGRQVGSSFKPIVAAAALEAGLPTSWHTDVTSGQTITGCGDYAPNNYDRSGGVEDMYSAMTESNNVFHVKLGVAVGVKKVAEMAYALGVDTEFEPGCASALGAADLFPIEMAEVFATFANDGRHCEPFAVSEIRDRSGDVILKLEPTCEQAITEETAQQITTLLRGVVDEGTARSARIGIDAAAKTGTTDDNGNAWLVGYAGNLSTAVWMGFETPTPMRDVLGYRSISGGTAPAKIWADFMSKAVTESDLARVRLARYRMPACPPPPVWDTPGDTASEEPAKGKEPNDDGDAVAQNAQSAEPSTKPSTAPEDREDLKGFDPQASTWATGTDGDSFKKGTQPEKCSPVAEPEAYEQPAPAPKPTPTPSDSESDELPGVPTSSPKPTSSPSPSPTPSSTPSDDPSPSPSPSSPSPSPSPTASSSEPTDGD